MKWQYRAHTKHTHTRARHIDKINVSHAQRAEMTDKNRTLFVKVRERTPLQSTLVSAYQNTNSVPSRASSNHVDEKNIGFKFLFYVFQFIYFCSFNFGILDSCCYWALSSLFWRHACHKASSF